MSESVPNAAEAQDEPRGDFYEHWLNVLAQEVFGDARPENWASKLAMRVRELNRARSDRQEGK